MLAAPIAQGQNVSQGPDAKQMTQMQDRMKQMQEQMDRIELKSADGFEGI
jgi:DNA-binding protein YbaB